MPILKREDGTQFVIQSYRELLSLLKPSVLRSEIRALALNHGEFIRFFPIDKKHIEGVFSRDPGILLAESIWQYFNKPADLIYCEALPGEDQAIVVAVKSGTVYLDGKIAFANLADELSSLLAGGVAQYQIYISGDVPVSDHYEEGKFYFEPSVVKSFEHLDYSVFQNLKVDPDYQLQPLETALRDLKVGPKRGKLLIYAALLAILMGVWWYMTREPVEVKPVVQKPAVPVNPYLAFEQGMMTPSPREQLAQVATVLQTTYFLPGWDVTAIRYNGQQYKIDVDRKLGTLSLLQEWTKQHNMQMTIDPSKSVLTYAAPLPARPKPTVIPDFNQSLVILVDRLNNILGDQSLSVKITTPVGAIKQAIVTINLTQASADMLNLIGSEIVDLPVKLNNVQLNFSDNSLSGNVQLTILGK